MNWVLFSAGIVLAGAGVLYFILGVVLNLPWSRIPWRYETSPHSWPSSVGGRIVQSLFATLTGLAFCVGSCTDQYNYEVALTIFGSFVLLIGAMIVDEWLDKRRRKREKATKDRVDH